MKVTISDPNVITRFNIAEKIHGVYLRNNIIFLLVCLVGVFCSIESVMAFVWIGIFGAFSIGYHLYLNVTCPGWHPYEHVTAQELLKHGYKYSHWNKFYKGGKAWYCYYPRRVGNHLEVDIREWTDSDNGEA